MKLFISAAEASSDIHASRLIKAIRLKYPNENIDFFGLGGPAMERVGFRSLVDFNQLTVMGFTEVLPKIFYIFKSFFILFNSIKNEKPDAVILLDYPGFHLKLAKKVYKKLGIPTVYYIPPKVWAWKKKRIYSLKNFCDKVLLVFPFEVSLYEKHKIPFSYVGNPLIEQLPFVKTRQSARKEFILSENQLVLALLLGSRLQEIRSHLSVVVEGLYIAIGDLLKLGCVSKESPLQVLCPIPSNINIEIVRSQFDLLMGSQFQNHEYSHFIQFHIFTDKSHEAMIASDCGLIKSGTSTLEAGLLGCPHILFYQVSKLSELIFKIFIRYKKPVGLVNLVLGVEQRELAPFKEMLGSDGFNSQHIAKEVLSLITDKSRVKYLKIKSEELNKKLIQSNTASENAAYEIINLVRSRKLRIHHHTSVHWLNYGFIFFVSTVWSALNSVRRFFYKTGLLNSTKLSPFVVSVGNIQAGGAGKTPFLAECARQMIQDGKNIAILTRGYRSHAEKTGALIEPFQGNIDVKLFGDEASMVHEQVPEAWIGVGRNRLKQFLEIEKKSEKKIDYILLDDGFQNFRIKKDHEVVLITSWRFYQKVYRDFPSQLKHGHTVVWSKGDKRPKVPSNTRLSEDVFEIKSEQPLETIKSVVLVSAVADNESVKEFAQQNHIKIIKHFSFPDHFHFDDLVFHKEVKLFLSKNEKIMTTRKDWVKLASHFIGFEQSFVILDIRVSFDYKSIFQNE